MANQKLDKQPQIIYALFSQIPDVVQYRHPLSYLTYLYNYISRAMMDIRA